MEDVSYQFLHFCTLLSSGKSQRSLKYFTGSQGPTGSVSLACKVLIICPPPPAPALPLPLGPPPTCWDLQSSGCSMMVSLLQAFAQVHKASVSGRCPFLPPLVHFQGTSPTLPPTLLLLTLRIQLRLFTHMPPSH